MKLNRLREYFLPGTVTHGIIDTEISSLTAMHLATPGDMTYILASRIKDVSDLLNHPATVIITDFDCTAYTDQITRANKCVLQTSNPRLQMAKLSHLFDYEKQDLGVHPLAKFFYSQIAETACIAPDVEIGNGSIIYANVTIYNGVRIGKNCIIHSGAVIGADGFGYEQDEEGNWFKIAHLGGVIIGDNVEIGANACIDRGTLSHTIIEDGAKIDNLVHIAHNVHIKKNAMVIANAMVAGSVVIGEGAWIAPSSSIREGRKIGDKALVGLGSVVTKDVEDGQTVMGVPAKPK